MSSTTTSRPASCARSKPARSAASSSTFTVPSAARLGPVGSTFPERVPPMRGHDLWDSNRPGSTLFLPVCDVSASLISLIAQFADPTLRRYAPAGGGMYIVDDRHGCRPAGTERWLKDGFLDAERMLPLSIVERQACYYA